MLGHPVRQAEPPWFIDGPAGIVSTAEDMARWMLAQSNGRLLVPELMEEYHKAGPSGPYGMGWMAGKEEKGGGPFLITEYSGRIKQRKRYIWTNNLASR